MDDYPNKHSTQATSTVSETEQFLSKLGHGYKRAKAQQILRLLRDQESLNQRFKDCALNDEDDDDDENVGAGEDNRNTSDIHNVKIDNGIKGGVYVKTGNVQTVAKTRLQHIDPSRCRTSMGFYNEAECSNDVDYVKEEICDFEAETDAAVLEEREALLGPLPSHSRFINHGSGRRLFRLQLDENEPLPEENTAVQSARSSRPKTGIATGSAKSKQYRRPSQTENRTRNIKHTTVSTSVSKLENPVTPRGNVRQFCEGGPSMPRDEYGSLVSTPRNISFQPLTPRNSEHHVVATPRKEEVAYCSTPRSHDLILNGHFQHDSSHCLTPRNDNVSIPLTPRQNDWHCLHTPRHNDISMASPRPKNPQRHVNKIYGQHTPRDDIIGVVPSPCLDESFSSLTPRTHGIRKYAPLKSVTVKESGAVSTAIKKVTIVDKSNGDSHKVSQHNGMPDRGVAIGVRMPTTPRSIITVNQSPMQTIPGMAENGEVLTPRRQHIKSDNNSSKTKNSISSMQRTGVHHNLNKLSERVQPITMMKLPPLEVTLNKPIIS